LEAYRSLRGRALTQIRTAGAMKRTALRMLRVEEAIEPLTLWDAA
jgi:hypothetical protein